MISPALRKIEDEINRLAEVAEQADYRVEPFDLRTLARRVGNQAEMLEKGIGE